jgi:hypothetical protein
MQDVESCLAQGEWVGERVREPDCPIVLEAKD